MKAKLYKTYVFRDKDPVIDHLRTAVKDDGRKRSQLAQDSGVSAATLSNWFEGTTRRPQFATVAAVARACGPKGVAAVVNAVKRGK